MTESILDDLAAHVERTVIAVAASRARQRQMRDELLAHLLGLYDEELHRLGDERAALMAAKGRFGDEGDLAGELRASVPVAERVFFFLIHGKERLMWRCLFALGVVAVLVGPGFIMPAVAKLRGFAPPAEGDSMALTVGLLSLGCVITLAGLGSLAWGVKALRARSS